MDHGMIQKVQIVFLLNLQQRPQSANFANQKLLYILTFGKDFVKVGFDLKISPG